MFTCLPVFLLHLIHLKHNENILQWTQIRVVVRTVKWYIIDPIKGYQVAGRWRNPWKVFNINNIKKNNEESHHLFTKIHRWNTWSIVAIIICEVGLLWSYFMSEGCCIIGVEIFVVINRYNVVMWERISITIQFKTLPFAINTLQL